MYQPSSNEYAPFYQPYISLVGNMDINRKLKNQLNTIDDFFVDIPEEKQDFAYAEGKWTIKQIVAHLIDTERVMVYRAMRFSKNDPTELQGFDQDAYVANTNIDALSYNDLVDEFLVLRQAHLFFFKSLKDADCKKKGIANGHSVSVGALLYIIAGHAEHHINIIKERYLKK
ncbi:MAG: DinB family protein [Sphingobacteriales bacterium]|nr:MAG: DinB family protein [Sphingobacteriales bacterium]